MTGIAEAAADAYLAGWALTQARFTDRAAAGCIAAVELACEHADDPGILETSLILGQLTGVWQTVYDRRERLQRKHERAVLAAWKACTASLDPRDVARWFRRDAYLPAESAVKDPTRKWWRDTAVATALSWLRGVYYADGYDALVAALADAIRSGMAEGEAGALALAASRQGKTGFRIADAFKAAYDRLANDNSVTQQAQDAATRIIDGAAGDAGRTLAAQAGQDGSEEDMAAAADGAVNGDDSSAVRWTDWAMWSAFGIGAMALYNQAGVQMVSWVTAGDSRVCARPCQGNEDDSPYLLGAVPEYPGHPRCRCYLDTSDSIASSFLAAFLN